MSNRALESVRLELQVIGFPPARSVLDRFFHAPGVKVDLIKGRVTKENARYSLRVAGNSQDVAHVVRLGHHLGAVIHPDAQKASRA